MMRPVNPAPDRTLLRLSYAQLILFLATWLAGIYINGFVSSPIGGSTVSFFLSAPVITHFVLGATTAAVGIMLLAFGWIYHLKRFTIFTGLSLASVAIAGTGGLCFVFGIGDSNLDSMIMATSFITAVYLNFFAILSVRDIRFIPGRRGAGLAQKISIATLGLFYLVFVFGIYLNLYVASTVFSEPASIEQKMLGNMVTSPAGLAHEGSGTLLVLLTLALTIVLFRSYPRKLALRGLVAFLFAVYSLLVGVFENIVPMTEPVSNLVLSSQNVLTSEVVPLISAAGFLVSLILVMTIAQSIMKQKSPVVSKVQ